MTASRGLSFGILLTPEVSCFNAVFGLAGLLRDRGHQVIFLVKSQSNFVDYVRSAGFEVAEIQRSEEQETYCRRSPLGRLLNHAPPVLARRQVYAKLCNLLSLDVCLLDDVREDVNLAATAFTDVGIPVILLSYTYASAFRSDSPPVFSSRIAARHTKVRVIEKLVNRVLWIWSVSTRGHNAARSRRDYLKLSLQKVLDQFRDRVFKRALQDRGINMVWSEWRRRPELPIIVFAHKCLDWPSLTNDPMRCYFGFCDLHRDTPSFDWSPIDTTSPIIYCNISTLVGMQKQVSLATDDNRSWESRSERMTRRYLDAVLKCFSDNPEWQLVLACGPFADRLRDTGLPGNIHLYSRVPQQAILQKASAAITWGGAGTVRECMTHKVPMLLFPAWTDQFGNAARVIENGAGLRDNIERIATIRLASMVSQLLNDSCYRSSIEELLSRDSDGAEKQSVLNFLSRHTETSI